MNKTNIEYMDFSWNPLVMRCNPVSEGCKNCWHLKMANRLAGNSLINEEKQKIYTGNGSPYLLEDELLKPLKKKKPSIIGVQFMGDLFHDSMPYDTVSLMWDIMFDCPQHTFLILTKRPERILGFQMWMEHEFRETWYDNIWLGITTENQKTADQRIPLLLQIPAKVRFVSVEPMLGEIDLKSNLYIPEDYCSNCKNTGHPYVDAGELSGYDYRRKCGCVTNNYLDWVICGAETGHGARPCKIEWVRNLRDQCVEAGVPFFFKKFTDGNRLIDGQLWGQYPEGVRQ